MSNPPAGRNVTVTRTWLELREQDRLTGAELPAGATVQVLQPCPAATYRRLYRTTGSAYHWRDRWDWSDETIHAHLARAGITLHVMEIDGEIAGWYELAGGEAGETELAYFGLLPGYAGRGLGKALLTDAVRRARAGGARRVWLHTCTLDDPAALPNYLRRGFVPFREEQYQVDLTDD